MAYLHFFGIDVSKDQLDVAVANTTAAPRRFANSRKGFTSLIAAYRSDWPNALVVLEATGGYETALLTALTKHNIAVVRAHPLRAKHFIRSLGQNAKTDALDARALARYGQERYPSLTLYRAPDPQCAAVAQLVMRRADLVAMRAAERNRRQHPRYAGLKASVDAILDALTAEIKTLETRITQQIKHAPNLAQKMCQLTAIKGIGTHTAATLLAFMPELGQITRRQAASLAGCAPHARDSGKRNGYRQVWGGRRAIKTALFMAALAAIRANINLKRFYQRLIQNGKKPIVALTAVMRKLITIANAKIRDANNSSVTA